MRDGKLTFLREQNKLLKDVLRDLQQKALEKEDSLRREIDELFNFARSIERGNI